MNFRFAYPALLFLILAAGAWAVHAWRRKPPSLTYSMTSAMAALAGNGRSFWYRLPDVLRLACMILLVLTAARPQLYHVSREIRTPGVDIMICLDTSGSMQAMDFELHGEPATRLNAVQNVVSDFIQKRINDRIGLVVFGQDAFTQAPLTLDKGLLLELVKKMEIGMAGDRTDIGTAIAIGGKRLKNLQAKSKTLILMTDGRHNAGDLSPEKAAETVRTLGIKIYTIGVGGIGPAPFVINTPFGSKVIRQPVDLDEETLRKVAEIGQGRYFRASDTRGLTEIYEIIDRKEKTEVKVKEFFHFTEIYVFFLVPAIGLLGLEILLKATIFRVIP